MGKSNYISLFEAALLIEYGDELVHQIKSISPSLNKKMFEIIKEKKRQQGEDWVPSEKLFQPMKNVFFQWRQLLTNDGASLDEHTEKVRKSLEKVINICSDSEHQILEGFCEVKKQRVQIPKNYLRRVKSGGLVIQDKHHNFSSVTGIIFHPLTNRFRTYCEKCPFLHENYNQVLVDWYCLKKMSKPAEKRTPSPMELFASDILKEAFNEMGPIGDCREGWHRKADVKRHLLDEMQTRGHRVPSDKMARIYINKFLNDNPVYVSS